MGIKDKLAELKRSETKDIDYKKTFKKVYRILRESLVEIKKANTNKYEGGKRIKLPNGKIKIKQGKLSRKAEIDSKEALILTKEVLDYANNLIDELTTT